MLEELVGNNVGEGCEYTILDIDGNGTLWFEEVTCDVELWEKGKLNSSKITCLEINILPLRVRHCTLYDKGCSQ